MRAAAFVRRQSEQTNVSRRIEKEIHAGTAQSNARWIQGAVQMSDNSKPREPVEFNLEAANKAFDDFAKNNTPDKGAWFAQEFIEGARWQFSKNREEIEKLKIEMMEAQGYIEGQDKEIERLKATPPTYIKLDETTEAFLQTKAAIANMQMFQKDALVFQHQNHELRVELESERAKLEHEKYCREANAKDLVWTQNERDGLKVELESERAKNAKLKREIEGLIDVIEGRATIVKSNLKESGDE